MPYIQVNDRKIEVDDDGFLVDPACWDEDVLKVLAEANGITNLNENHLKVIYYLRDYYSKYGSTPITKKLCKETGFTIIQIHNLFPAGPAYGAGKLAGLPKPSGCV